MDKMIGLHIPTGKEFPSGLEIMEKYNLGTFQIFTIPKLGRGNCLLNPKLWKTASNKYNAFIHSPYTCVWKLDDEKSQGNIKRCFENDGKLGGNCKGWVYHIPKQPKKETAKCVKGMLGCNPPYRILLEMKAMKPDKLAYTDPEDIIELIEELKKLDITSDQVGICIDTAHIYITGAEIKKYDDADNYLNKLEKYSKWIGLFHINGSQTDIKVKHNDKHAVPFGNKDEKDYLWGGMKYKSSGMYRFEEFSVKHNIPIVCEIRSDMHSIKKMLLHIGNPTGIKTGSGVLSENKLDSDSESDSTDSSDSSDSESDDDKDDKKSNADVDKPKHKCCSSSDDESSDTSDSD